MVTYAGICFWHIQYANLSKLSALLDSGAIETIGPFTKSFSFEVTVTTPKGMRAAQFPVNGSDVIHVYSDESHIWIQLRRDVPTEQDIGRPSFKVALCMQPGTAQKLGLELMNIAEKNKERMKAKSSSAAAPKAPKAKT